MAFTGVQISFIYEIALFNRARKAPVAFQLPCLAIMAPSQAYQDEIMQKNKTPVAAN